MCFSMKNTLKSNRYHTSKHTSMVVAILYITPLVHSLNSLIALFNYIRDGMSARCRGLIKQMYLILL